MPVREPVTEADQETVLSILTAGEWPAVQAKARGHRCVAHRAPVPLTRTRSIQINALSAAGQLTPAVAEASLGLLDVFRTRGMEVQLVRTMQRVAMEIGEALARQHAPPSVRLVESLAAVDLESLIGRAQAKAALSAAFQPGGECTRDSFVSDAEFFLEARLKPRLFSANIAVTCLTPQPARRAWRTARRHSTPAFRKRWRRAATPILRRRAPRPRDGPTRDSA
jgi:hypothetical protein